MEKHLPFIYTVALFLALSVTGYSQKKSKEDKNQKTVKNQVILVSKDTLVNVDIHRGRANTNEDRLAFSVDGTKRTMQAKDLTSYHDGVNYFKTYPVQGQSGVKLIDFRVIGPIYFGRSMQRNGETAFYVMKEGSNQVISLTENRGSLEKFFKEFLPDYETFVSKTKLTPKYFYSNLANFISAYNAYTQPSVYLVEKYRSPERLKFSPFGAYNHLAFKYTEGETNFNTGSTYSAGGIVHYNRASKYSVNTYLYYQKSALSSEDSDLLIEGLYIEPSFNLAYPIASYLTLGVEPGLGMSYNLKSIIDRKYHEIYMGDKVNLSQLNVGYVLRISLTFKDRFRVFSGYSKYRYETDNFKHSVFGDTSKNATLTSLQVGASIRL